jgi:hypothetical protein
VTLPADESGMARPMRASVPDDVLEKNRRPCG